MGYTEQPCDGCMWFCRQPEIVCMVNADEIIDHATVDDHVCQFFLPLLTHRITLALETIAGALESIERMLDRK